MVEELTEDAREEEEMDMELPKELGVSKTSNFAVWYNRIIQLADLIEKRYNVAGMFVWKPYGFQIMDRIKKIWDKLLNFFRKPSFKRLLIIIVIALTISFVVAVFISPFWLKRIDITDITIEKETERIGDIEVKIDRLNAEVVEQKIKSHHRNFLATIFNIENQKTLYDMYIANKEIPVEGEYEAILNDPTLTLIFTGGYPDKYFKSSFKKNDDGTYEVPYGSKGYFTFLPKDRFDIGIRRCLGVLYKNRDDISFKPHNIYVRQNSWDFNAKFIIIFVFCFIFISSIFSIYYKSTKKHS